MTMYIVSGPMTIGNTFGFYGSSVPDGYHAIVYDGEYTNGGYGPNTADGKIYKHLAKAKEAMSDLAKLLD